MTDIPKAQRSLSRRDPVLREIIRAVGPCTLEPTNDYFVALVRSIVGQQISGKAAQSIYERLRKELCRGRVRPRTIANATEDDLRAMGLSAAKTRSIQHLAQEVTSRRLKLSHMEEMPDEEVITELIRIRGIGRWTAQMFLMFSLGRMDILPVDDLGLKNGIKQFYQLEELPTVSEIHALADNWKPYCSVATWYFWRGLDL